MLVKDLQNSRMFSYQDGSCVHYTAAGREYCHSVGRGGPYNTKGLRREYKSMKVHSSPCSDCGKRQITGQAWPEEIAEPYQEYDDLEYVGMTRTIGWSCERGSYSCAVGNFLKGDVSQIACCDKNGILAGVSEGRKVTVVMGGKCDDCNAMTIASVV